MNIKIILTISFLGAGFFSLSAEDVLVLTEQRSLELAMGRNLSLKLTRLNVEDRKDAVTNGWNHFLPDFSTSLGVSRSDVLFTDPLPGQNNKWGVAGTISAELPLNFSSVLSIDNTKISYGIQSLGLEMEQALLEVQVKKQFYYLLTFKENLNLQQRNLKLAEKRYIQTQTNYRNGLASELNVLEAKTSYESLRPAYTDSKTTYETQIMSFKKLLELDLDQDIHLSGSLDVPILELDPEKLIDSMMMKRLDIQSSLKTRTLSENTFFMNKAGKLSPSLILSTDWGSSALNMSDIDWMDSYTISASIRMSLNGFIPGSSSNLSLRSSSREVKRAQYSLEDTVSRAEQDIRTIIMQLNGYKENIEITKLSVDLALKTYEMMENAFSQGRREILDVEGAQNKLLSANQDLLFSKYYYLSGLIDLENALNSSLEDISNIK